MCKKLADASTIDKTYQFKHDNLDMITSIFVGENLSSVNEALPLYCSSSEVEWKL